MKPEGTRMIQVKIWRTHGTQKIALERPSEVCLMVLLHDFRRDTLAGTALNIKAVACVCQYMYPRTSLKAYLRVLMLVYFRLYINVIVKINDIDYKLLYIFSQSI